MTHPDGPDPLDLDSYLDGQGDAASRAAFEARLAASPALQRQANLSASVDQSLRRQFPVESAPPVLLERLQREIDGSPGPRRADGRRRVALFVGGLAASLLIGAFWWSSRDPAPEPFFQQRAIAEVYRDAVAAGFEPYYECRENERFAGTFRVRQGKRLWLNRPPAGVRMLGLSYPGGTSRNSTGMLCEVHGAQVMVIVDRAEHHAASLLNGAEEDLHVFSAERFGLRFYEVGPLSESHLIGLFSDEFADGVEAP